MYLYFDECIFTFPHYNDSNGIIAFYPFDTDSTRRHILMNNIFQSLGVVLIQILLKSYFGLNNNSIIKKYDEKIDEIKSEMNQLENNLQFFSNVEDDNPMVVDVHKKIKKHKLQLEQWTRKLSSIKKTLD